MTFVDSDLEPDEDTRLSETIAQDVASALGTAVDIAASIKQELLNDAKDGLFAYISACRSVAIEDLTRMFAVLEDCDATDPEAVKAIRVVQRSFLKYASGVAFAQNAVRGYIGFGQAENLEGDDSDPESIVMGIEDG